MSDGGFGPCTGLASLAVSLGSFAVEDLLVLSGAEAHDPGRLYRPSRFNLGRALAHRKHGRRIFHGMSYLVILVVDRMRMLANSATFRPGAQSAVSPTGES